MQTSLTTSSVPASFAAPCELDFPPNGSRDANNNPIGFDVDYCNDLGKALGVEVEIVDTPENDRIPAILSGRADVAVAVASDTLERAKTVGFSIPYFVFKTIVLAREDSGIKGPDDIKGHTVGGPAGAYETLALAEEVKKIERSQLADADVPEPVGHVPGAWTKAHRCDLHHLDDCCGNHRVRQISGPEGGRRLRRSMPTIAP